MKEVKKSVKVLKVLLSRFYYLFYTVFIKNLPSNNSPKAFGCKLRRLFLKPLVRKIGKNVNIQPQVRMFPLWNIEIGDNSGIGRGSYISAEAEVIIGANVLIAPELFIYTANHLIGKNQLIIKQGMIKKFVKIGDDVWIGARVTILPGVEIGTGSVIGAGAVVTRSVEPYTIVGGVPARKIGIRG